MRIEKIGRDPFLKKDIKKMKFEPDELPKMQLFSSDDVIMGNPSSNIAAGFVYTWKSDRPPEDVMEFFQKISSYANMAGLWKTTNGARYVFANILANPNINKLVLLVFGLRDNGHLLAEALTNFWKNGVDGNGIIIGSKSPNPKFEQVPLDALERVRRQCDLVVIRNIGDFERTQELVRCMIEWPKDATPVPDDVEFYSQVIKNKRLYDDGARFDKPYKLDLSTTAKKVKFIEKYSRLPLGQTVHADNLVDALEMVTAFVYEKGDMFRDQRGVITMESRSFSVTIRDVLQKIPEHFSEDYIKKYVSEFMDGTGEKLDEFAYTYHDRIFRRWGNQVDRAIAVLKKNPNTRRCMITLWDPEKDIDTSSPPCLDFIWFVVRGKKLEMHSAYRSQHIATVTKEGRLMEGEGAFVPNLYALGTLHQHVAGKTGFARGPLVLTDFSAHLYMSDV
jgi:thymidylate synthase/tetrahydromethanopterin S-methyltransferase subunit A